jgi:hypothetical protein
VPQHQRQKHKLLIRRVVPFYTLHCNISVDSVDQGKTLSPMLAQPERREEQAMEKLEKALPLVMGLVFGISLVATAWDISFVSALP